MELQFKKEEISCLEPILRQVQNIEETQELRLSDGMPDIGKVLSAWGQVIIRGKEWQESAVSLSAGMMVWVLYLPEDGAEPRCMDTWVPFQVRWDLPEGAPEGNIRIECLTRFVDARSVSARKIMLRCGMAALAECYGPITLNYCVPEEMPEDVQLLRRTYPVRLPRESGEKTFLMEEELQIPASMPQPEKLIYYRMTPTVAEQKIQGDKLVFRGSGTLHLLYQEAGGRLHSWDCELPFSQYAQLDRGYSADAEADVLMGVTSVELEIPEGGKLQLKCGLVGQYLITDREILELVTDAYSTLRELEAETEMLKLPSVLETRAETVRAEQTLHAEAETVADVQFLQDFPRQYRMEDLIRMETPGIFQVLYYGTDGILGASALRWEGILDIPGHPDTRLAALPAGIKAAQAVIGGAAVTLKAEPQLQITVTSGQGLPMVAALELGETVVPEENRPSLILRRAGEDGLWDVAKNSRSTVEAIKKANNMDGDPVPGQMLLIPVS